MNVVQPSVGQLCLGKKMDGTCVFLYQLSGRWRCGLQQTKPKACKMWPFKILGKPKYGNAREAAYHYRDSVFYVYIDPICIGTNWGTPSKELIQKTLPEFVDIGLGLKEKQYHSTSKTPFQSFRLL
jgi:Fe-S-cluster containining protein